MDIPTWYYVLLPILLTALGVIITLWILYYVIRTAISHGLRDHQRWLERDRPQHPSFTSLH